MTEVLTKIKIDNDNLIRVYNLRNKKTGEFINDCIITGILTDVNGISVDGVTWPVLFEYSPNSNGQYTGVIPSAAILLEDVEYRFHIDYLTPAGGHASAIMRLLAVYDYLR